MENPDVTSTLRWQQIRPPGIDDPDSGEWGDLIDIIHDYVHEEQEEEL